MIVRRGRGVPARALNPIVALAVGRLGVPLPGLRMLRVHGRRTGRLRSVPVLIASVGRARYLVAARGTTDWSRNLDAAGWGELIRGRRSERVAVDRVTGIEREQAVQAYLRRYGWAVRRLLDLPSRPRAHEIARAATTRPVFRISPWEPARGAAPFGSSQAPGRPMRTE